MNTETTKTRSRRRIAALVAATGISATGAVGLQVVNASPSHASDRCPIYTTGTAGILQMDDSAVQIWVPAGRTVQVRITTLPNGQTSGITTPYSRTVTNGSGSDAAMWIDAPAGQWIQSAQIIGTACAS